MAKDQEKFLDSYFKNADNIKAIEPSRHFRVDWSELTMDNYLAGKNELFMSLADPSIFNYFNKTFKQISSDPKVDSWHKFQRSIGRLDIKKRERNLNLDDATNVAIKRLGFFTKPSREVYADKPRDVQRNINRWYKYQIQASNFVGNFALNGLMERDYVVWDKSDNVKQFVKHRLLPNGSEQGDYLFFLVFPVDADYPYTIIEKVDDSLPFDETAPFRNVSEKTYEKIKNGNFCAFWDQAEWINMMNDEFDTGYWNVNRVKIDTPQQRFKFVRQYIAGLSQNALAQIFKDEYGITADQKKIDYWEKTDNEFPPFFKNDNLEICAEIFAEKGFDLLTYELRDNIGQDFVSKRDVEEWLIDFIRKDKDEMLIYEVPALIERTTNAVEDYDSESVEINTYKDALKRYKLDSRYADEVRGVDSITPKMLMMYFGILNEMSEKELLRDLELVYDNEKLRAKVYGFWRAFRTRVPKPIKKEVPFS
mgnify:CR=1 FL=1